MFGNMERNRKHMVILFYVDSTYAIQYATNLSHGHVGPVSRNHFLRCPEEGTERKWADVITFVRV